MIRTLIVDDEALARQLVREYLRPHADIDLVGDCGNGFDAVQALAGDGHAGPIDLVFLDIQMPQLSGLEVLELTGRKHGVIFTTAFDQYALKAFDLHAVDYLLKPFTQTRFDQALEQARKALQHTSSGLRSLLADAQARPERLLIRERNQVHVVPVATIDCIEAQDDYVSIHVGARSYLKTQSLSDLHAQLDPRRFVRVHRSWVINIDRLQQLERSGKDSLMAVLSTHRQVPISRAGYERVKPFITP